MIATSFVPNHEVMFGILMKKKVEKGTYFNGIPKDLHFRNFWKTMWIFRK